jgi:DNA-binding LytR/AlgR family response regulator
LDHSIFFRVNRQYIINFNFIKSFKPYQKSKTAGEYGSSGFGRATYYQPAGIASL